MPKRKAVSTKKGPEKRAKKESTSPNPTLLDFLKKSDASNNEKKTAPNDQCTTSENQESKEQKNVSLANCESHNESKEDTTPDKEIMAHDKELLAEIKFSLYLIPSIKMFSR